MKTLGKLKLNEEKMLSHEELLGFRGGSGTYQCYTKDFGCGLDFPGCRKCWEGGYSFYLCDC
jgi:hypothetical protein